ncbi:MAG: RIP metalloprotease RseP [Spirochaetaceae bacterium]
MILNIVIGLAGLGIVVFVHELGHLIAAKLVGIDVEVFSLGWGRRLAGFSYKGTEYQVSVFPIGGFCKMRGEESLRTAWQEEAEEIPREPGSFFGASPLQRIFVAIAGPAVNLLFAVVAFAIMWGLGFSIETFPNRIVLASEYSEGPFPADDAGLRSGDVIVEIDNEEIVSFRDIQQTVARAPDEQLNLTVRRDGRELTATLEPKLNPQTGAGQIGVYPWVEPVVGHVEESSSADAAGLRPGDRILSVNGREIRHSLAFMEFVGDTSDPVNVTVSRDGTRVETTLVPGVDPESGLPDVGIAFAPMVIETPDYGPLQAVGRGISETVDTLVLSVRSIGLLFRGVDVTQAVAGPLRITYIVGEVATSGLETGLGEAVRSFFSFLSVLSVALFIMNLLPIPVLDGGQILLYTIEGIGGRPLRPKIVYRYQMVGTVIVLALIVLAFLGDVLFLAQR